MKNLILSLLLSILTISCSSDDVGDDVKATVCIVCTECGDLLGAGCSEGWCEGETGLGVPLTLEALESYKDYLNENGATCSVK